MVGPETLGLTEPNAIGRRYRYGTLIGYSRGRCRCDYCKDVYAQYRAERGAFGKDYPRGLRSLDIDGHIPSDWFRNKVWKLALKSGEPGDSRLPSRLETCPRFMAAGRWR